MARQRVDGDNGRGALVRGFSYDRETLLMIEALKKKLGYKSKSEAVRVAIREKYMSIFGSTPPESLLD